jgi:predicted phage terminase large subunit-like protein
MAEVMTRRRVKLVRHRHKIPQSPPAHVRQDDGNQVIRTGNLAGVAVDKYKLIRSVCRDSYVEFVRTFWSIAVPEKPIWNWHMDYLCDEIQTCLERVFKSQDKLYDLNVNVCPGSSKSSIFSVFLLPWAWTRMQSFRMIGASYAYPLALNLSRLSRMVVKSELYRKCFPEVELSKDQAGKGFFVNTKGGSRYAVGSNGSVLGMHAHGIVVDDPLDPQEALSEAELARTNYWIPNTLLRRKVSSAISVVFMVMQRLHQDDPSARMAKRPDVKTIKIPAENDYEILPPDLEKFYTQVPEGPPGHKVFDPVRFPKKTLDVLKLPTELGPVSYAGQFGQDPVPLGGGMFKTKMLRHASPPDKFKLIVRFWDKAGTTTKRSAFTVGVKMALDYESRVWVLHVVRGQWDSFTREKVIRQTADRDGPKVLIGLEQEPGSSGLESSQRTAAQTLMGYRVRYIKPTGDKALRADPFSTQVNAGNVWLPNNVCVNDVWTDWAFDYVEELRHFPSSRFKDQVDSSSGAFSLLWKGRIRVGGLTPSRKKGHNLFSN